MADNAPPAPGVVRKFDEQVPNLGEILTVYDRCDVNAPNATVLKESDTNVLSLTKISSQNLADSVAKLAEFVTTHCTLKPDVPKPGAGDDVMYTRDQQKEELIGNVNKTFLLTRKVQQAADSLAAQPPGTTRPTWIVPIPKADEWKDDDPMEANTIRQIPEFAGDSADLEADCTKLETFLTTLFDSCRDKSSKASCRATLLLKLTKNAKQLIETLRMNSMDDKGTIPPGKPTLEEIVQVLQNYYFVGVSPALARQKLTQVTRGQMTYQRLCGHIGSLCRTACLGELESNKKTYFTKKCAEVFLQAVSQKDREVIKTENLNRQTTGRQELNMENMALFLLQNQAEKDVYKPFRKDKTQDDKSSIGDLESIRQMAENRNRPPFRPNRGTFNRGSFNRGKPNRGSFNRGRGRWNNNNNGKEQDNRPPPSGAQIFYRGKNNYRDQYTSGNFRNQNNFSANNQNNRGRYQSSYRKPFPQRGFPTNRRNQGNRSRPFNFSGRGINKGQNRPSFVTPSQANVGDNACLRCGSRNHFFQNKECKYYNTPLFSSPCPNCQRGAHGGKYCQETTRNYLGSSTKPRYTNQRERFNILREDYEQEEHFQRSQQDFGYQDGLYTSNLNQIQEEKNTTHCKNTPPSHWLHHKTDTFNDAMPIGLWEDLEDTLQNSQKISAIQELSKDRE